MCMVSDATAAALLATVSLFPSAERATGPVLINAPLPQLSGFSLWNSLLAKVRSLPFEAEDRTALVWIPTSGGELAYQRRKLFPIASIWHSFSAMASRIPIAIAVSSVHSPGAQPKPPPFLLFHHQGGDW